MANGIMHAHNVTFSPHSADVMQPTCLIPVAAKICFGFLTVLIPVSSKL